MSQLLPDYGARFPPFHSRSDYETSLFEQIASNAENMYGIHILHNPTQGNLRSM